jgi:hypothetical protein
MEIAVKEIKTSKGIKLETNGDQIRNIVDYPSDG